MSSKRKTIGSEFVNGGEKDLHECEIRTLRESNPLQTKEIMLVRSMQVICGELGINLRDMKNQRYEFKNGIFHIKFQCPKSSSMIDIHILNESAKIGVAIYTTPMDEYTHVGIMIMPLPLLTAMRKFQNSLVQTIQWKYDDLQESEVA